MPGRQRHLLSVGAQLGLKNRGYPTCCSTKGAIAMLVRQHALELARHWLTNPVTREQVPERIQRGRVAEPQDLDAPMLSF